MRLIRTPRTLAIILLLALVAVGCGDGESQQAESPATGATDATDQQTDAEAAGGDTLNIALSSVLEVFDPREAQPVAKNHLNLMFDHLVGLNADGSEISKDTGVFSDWQTDDNQTWVFTMRPGYVFHNGEPMTAEDVKFSLDRLQDEEQATSAYSTWYRDNIDSVEVTGESEVTITLNAPSFQLPLYLSPLFGLEGAVLPQAYMEEVGPDGFADAPIGSGPYQLADHEPGSSLTYTVTDSEHPVVSSPEYETVEFQVVEETGSRISLLETGDVDVIDVGTTQAAELQNGDGISVVEKPSGNQIGITFHEQWRDGALGNEQVRQALALSVDAEAINEAIFAGLGEVTGNYPAGPLSIGFESLEPYPYDPEQARSLLEEAYDGTTIELYAFPLPGLPELPDVAETVEGYWSEVGVNVELIPTEFSSFVQDWVGYNLGGNAASPVGFAHRPLGLAYYENGFSSEGGSTVTHDPNIDALIEEGRAAADDREEYGAVTRELNQYVYDNYLSLPLVRLNSFYAAKEGIDWSPGEGQYDMNPRGLVSP